MRRGRLSRGARIRLAFEQLGVTYIKLGQYLALRFDVVPRDVVDELNKLFDEVPPAPLEEVIEAIAVELGAPVEALFESFDPRTVAAASVAQVYEARTVAGERVAVKVRRPNVIPVFDADMRNLRRIARVADAVGLLGRLSAREALDEFATWTRREFDFVREGRTADRLRENALPYEVVPRIHWDLTSAGVLTMEYVEGTSLNDVVKAFRAGGPELVEQRFPGLDLDGAIHRLAVASLRQIFVIGFFHGDPHPGNILVLEDGRIAFLDFGIFGEMSDYRRRQVLGYIESLSAGDIERAFERYSQLVELTETSDVARFRREGIDLFRRWYGAAQDPSLPVRERHLGRYSGEMLDIVRRSHLTMGMDTLIFWRALNTLDATALQVAAYFDLLTALREFFESTLGGFYERLADALGDDGECRAELAAFAVEVPNRLGRVLQAGATAEWEWTVVAEDTPSRRGRSDGEAMLLAGALVLATAVLVASSAALGATARAAFGAAGAAFFLLLVYTGAKLA